MKNLVKMQCVSAGLLALLIAGITGCDWTSGGGVETWTSTGYDWANFSGTYRAPDGKVLVREFGALSNEVGKITVTNTVSNERLAVGDGVRTEYSGHTSEKPMPGTLSITVGSYRFTDSAANTTVGTYNLNVIPNDGSSGTINYAARYWTLRFPGPVDNNTPIIANYLYLADDDHAGQGSHGQAIYSFVVNQTGNSLQLIDSNGAVYTGSIGDMNTTAGQQYDPSDESSTLLPDGDVFAQFHVSGQSQGYSVEIAGVFRGTIRDRSMTDRSMNATFVEHGGYQADINAVTE